MDAQHAADPHLAASRRYPGARNNEAKIALQDGTPLAVDTRLVEVATQVQRDVPSLLRGKRFRFCRVLAMRPGLHRARDIEKTRDRYKEQYGAMEATVNSFKSTGEYLTNYMDAQNSD